MLAKSHRVVPVARKILADQDTALTVYRKLAADRPGTFLLESAAHGQSWSRYSFIGTGSRCALTAKNGAARWIGQPPADLTIDPGTNPLTAVAHTLQDRKSVV